MLSTLPKYVITTIGTHSTGEVYRSQLVAECHHLGNIVLIKEKHSRSILVRVQSTQCQDVPTAKSETHWCDSERNRKQHQLSKDIIYTAAVSFVEACDCRLREVESLCRNHVQSRSPAASCAIRYKVDLFIRSSVEPQSLLSFTFGLTN